MNLLEHTEKEAAVTTGTVHPTLIGVRIVPKRDSCLVRAHLTVEGKPAALQNRTKVIDELISRLEFVDKQESFVLLKTVFQNLSCGILYFVEKLKDGLHSTLNVDPHDGAWTHAFLPL